MGRVRRHKAPRVRAVQQSGTRSSEDDGVRRAGEVALPEVPHLPGRPTSSDPGRRLSWASVRPAVVSSGDTRRTLAPVASGDELSSAPRSGRGSVRIRDDPAEAPLANCWKYWPSGVTFISVYIRIVMSMCVLTASVTGLFVFWHDCSMRAVFAGFISFIMGFWFRTSKEREVAEPLPGLD